MNINMEIQRLSQHYGDFLDPRQCRQECEANFVEGITSILRMFEDLLEDMRVAVIYAHLVDLLGESAAYKATDMITREIHARTKYALEFDDNFSEEKKIALRLSESLFGEESEEIADALLDEGK